jgi:hypothetical protein
MTTTSMAVTAGSMYWLPSSGKLLLEQSLNFNSIVGSQEQSDFVLKPKVMLENFLSDQQRHELVAVGHSTTFPTTSPKEDIVAMRDTLRYLMEVFATAGHTGHTSPGLSKSR